MKCLDRGDWISHRREMEMHATSKMLALGCVIASWGRKPKKSPSKGLSRQGGVEWRRGEASTHPTHQRSANLSEDSKTFVAPGNNLPEIRWSERGEGLEVYEA